MKTRGCALSGLDEYVGSNMERIVAATEGENGLHCLGVLYNLMKGASEEESVATNRS